MVNKWQVVVEVAICVLVVTTAGMLIPLFVLIPAAIAFPVAVDNRKLLYIPAGVAGVFLLLVLVFYGVNNFITTVPFLGILVGIMAAVGVVAGLLVRSSREAGWFVKVLAVVGGIAILLAPGVFVLDMFSGFLRRPNVNRIIRTYVAENYADFDLIVNGAGFNFKSGDFSALVQDSNNPDISFRVNFRNGAIHDGFTSSSFWAGTIEYMLTPLLEEEFADEFQRETPSIAGVRTGLSVSVSGVQVGQNFDKAADVEKTARIIATAECATPEALTAQIMRFHEFISQSGFNFDSYMFHFQYVNAPPIRGRERVIDISVDAEIINENLPAMIEYARYNRRDNGVFHRDYFRYVSRVEMENLTECAG